jgi:GT2 family glycosyltransferase
MPVSVTVIIVTLNRPECVRKCLECLAEQRPLPEQVIVVDASRDEATRAVVSDFPSVLYLRNDNGFGRMTASRNIGLKRSTGDIIAFLDDDAFAHAGWLRSLIDAYDADDVGAVGGRALNNQPGEATQGAGKIGRLTKNGRLEGWFAADSGRVIDVEHVMGCNMSFRREVLARLGGFREDYPGISGVREDSDMCLRVRQLGYRIRFTPFAVATHVGAPQAVGKRFDVRYVYYSARNHTVMLLRNRGMMSAIFCRYIAGSLAAAAAELIRRIAGGFARFGAVLLGNVAGAFSGLRLVMRLGHDPVRHDKDANDIRAALETRAAPQSVHSNSSDAVFSGGGESLSAARSGTVDGRV